MTADEKAFCENWCKAHARTWQVLNRSEWKYQFHPKTLVRYVEEVRQTEQEIQLLLDFLSSDESIATLSLYDQSIADSWKPTRAWLELSNKSVQGVRSVRLYHGLQTDANQSADGPYVVENGCAYKVSMTYYWNRTTPPSVPSGSSGIGYQVVGLQRDPDTGLYTYAIEKRERIQQDVPEYLSSTTVFENVKEESHLGVRQADVASTGKQASVANGTIVRRKLSKNVDCTTDIQNTTVEERSVSDASESVSVGLSGKTVTTVKRNMSTKASTDGLDVGESVENTKTDGGRWNQTIRKLTPFFLKLSEMCRKTSFAHAHSVVTVQGTDPGFTHVSEAGGGKVSSKSVSRTDTGAYKIDEEETNEIGVSGASESVQASLTGTTRVVTNRNQATKANSSGLDVGESVENSKTDGGLWNQTIKTVVRNANLWLGETCRKTIFAHLHTTRNVQGSDPGFSHASEAGGGKTVEKSVSRTSDGSYEIVESTTEEASVSGVRKSWRKTLRGTMASVTDRSQTSPLNGNGMKVGESRSSEETDGGRWNNTVEKNDGTPAGNTSEGCERTVVEHTHTKTDNVSSKPSVEGVASVNRRVRVSAQRTDVDTWDVTTSETTYEQNTFTTTDGSPVVTTTTTVGTNQANIPSGGAAGQNKVRRINASLNDHGSYSVRDEVTTYNPTSASANAGSTLASKAITVERNATSATITQSPSTNKTVEASISPNDHGSYDKHVTVTTYSPATITGLKAGSQVAEVEIEIGKNVVDRPTGEIGTTNVETSISADKNDHGSYDYQKRKTTYKPFGPTVVSTSDEPLKTTKTEVFQHVESVPERNGGTNVDVDMNVSRNSVGSFDGKAVTITYKPDERTLGTIKGNKKDTTITGFWNKETPPQEKATTNEELHVSAHMNGHGTFDGTIHKDTYSSDERTLGTIKGNKKDTTITGFWNAVTPPQEQATTNEELHVSAHMNGHGTFDGTIHKDTYSSDEKVIAQANGPIRNVEIKGYWNQVTPLTVTGGQGDDVSASAHMNSHGTYDGTTTKITYSPNSGTATSETETQRSVTTVTINDTNGRPQGFHASAHPNEHGSYTTSVTNVTPKHIDSNWVKWDSTSQTPNSEITFECGVRVFENLTYVPTPPYGTEASLSIRINEFGRYCGHISYRKLKRWKSISSDTGSGSQSGWVMTGVRKKDKEGVNYTLWINVCSTWIKGGLSASSAALYAKGSFKHGRCGEFYVFDKIVDQKWEKDEGEETPSSTT